MGLLIVCQDWRYEFTVSFILDKTKKWPKILFFDTIIFFRKNSFLSIWNSEFFYLPRPAGKTNWTVVINFPQNCSRRERKKILIIHHKVSMNWLPMTPFDFLTLIDNLLGAHRRVFSLTKNDQSQEFRSECFSLDFLKNAFGFFFRFDD